MRCVECGAEATVGVFWRGPHRGPYSMCVPCRNHSVRNRGADSFTLPVPLEVPDVRLSPTGENYICVSCDRTWDKNRSPGCNLCQLIWREIDAKL